MNDLKVLYEVSCNIISRCENLGGKAELFLQSDIPVTKDNLLAMHFLDIPSAKDAMCTFLELQSIELSDEYVDEYSDVIHISCELLSRAVMVSQICFDIAGLFTEYGYTPDTVTFYQLKHFLALSLNSLQHTLAELKRTCTQKPWTIFHPITKFIPEIKSINANEFVTGEVRFFNGMNPTPLPIDLYAPIVDEVFDALQHLITTLPSGSRLKCAEEYLLCNGIDYHHIDTLDVSEINDPYCILALIAHIYSYRRFGLSHFYENGSVLRWLEQLQDLDLR